MDWLMVILVIGGVILGCLLTLFLIGFIAYISFFVVCLGWVGAQKMFENWGIL